jgi:molybdate transport system ATP-binding protein
MIQIDISKTLKSNRFRFSFSGSTNRVVVFGPSGSGKTLLLKMIAGFFDPDRGEISVEGLHLFSKRGKVSLPIHQRNIGYLPQEYTLFPNMNVRENIQYGIKTRKHSVNPDKIENLVERMGIASKMDQYPRELSGGQKQRVALARAILVKPKILLLDEPFSALDSSIRESLRDLVIDIADEMQIVTLFVTHDLEEAFIFGEEIVLVNHGEVIEFGSKRKIFDSPLYAETANLMGFINIWPVKRLQDQEVRSDQGHVFTHQGDYTPDYNHLCIRPENIMFIREDVPNKASLKKNMVSGTITEIHHRGKYMNLVMKTDKELQLTINLPVHAFKRLKLSTGKQCNVSLKEESIILCKDRTGSNG